MDCHRVLISGAPIITHSLLPCCRFTFLFPSIVLHFFSFILNGSDPGFVIFLVSASETILMVHISSGWLNYLLLKSLYLFPIFSTGSALLILNTKLQTLGLVSLEHIGNGNVIVYRNTDLCYASTLNWDTLFNDHTKQKSTVQDNKKNLQCGMYLFLA